MPWTAKLNSTAVNQFNVVATVTFTNDVTGEEIVLKVPGNDLTAESLATYVDKQIALLDVRDASKANLDTLIGLDVPKPTPDQDKIDRDAFFALYLTYKKLTAMVASGLLKADDAELATVTADVKQGLEDHPEYRDDFRFGG